MRTTEATELAATMSLLRWPRITEYTLKARPHTMSLAAAGMAKRMKSRISSPPRASRSRTRRRITRQRALSSRHTATSAMRVMLVASATPTMPSFGKGPMPKMKQALSSTFISTALQCTAALIFTRSTLRMTHRYTVANPPSTYAGLTARRYPMPSEISSGSLVKMRMSPSGKMAAARANTRLMSSVTRSDRPITRSTARRSPLPQYWEASTVAPEEMPYSRLP